MQNKRFRYIGIEFKRNKFFMEYSYTNIKNIKNTTILELNNRNSFNSNKLDNFAKSFLIDNVKTMVGEIYKYIDIIEFTFEDNNKSKLKLKIKDNIFDLIFNWEEISLNNNIPLPDSEDNMEIGPKLNSRTLKWILKNIKNNKNLITNFEFQTRLILLMETMETKRFMHILSIISTLVIAENEDFELFLSESTLNRKEYIIKDNKINVTFTTKLNKRTLKSNHNISVKFKNKFYLLITNNNDLNLITLNNLIIDLNIKNTYFKIDKNRLVLVNDNNIIRSFKGYNLTNFITNGYSFIDMDNEIEILTTGEYVQFFFEDLLSQLLDKR